jgi:hypothetical protein
MVMLTALKELMKYSAEQQLCQVRVHLACTTVTQGSVLHSHGSVMVNMTVHLVMTNSTVEMLVTSVLATSSAVLLLDLAYHLPGSAMTITIVLMAVMKPTVLEMSRLLCHRHPRAHQTCSSVTILSASLHVTDAMVCLTVEITQMKKAV